MPYPGEATFHQEERHDSNRRGAMMTLHKLSAGNGYTYLTKQVAANDAADTGYANLGEYYSERGEAPGVWLGRGLAGLEDGPCVGDRVHEAQMVALFGQGRHPNADAIEQAALATGPTASTRLGQPFAARSASSEFRHELARRVVTHNRERGERPGAAVPDEVRAELRTELAREWFARDHGREPGDARELTDYVIGASRPRAQSVAGYDLTFSPVKSVSTLWAIADPDVAREVAAAHDAAVRDVIDWLEREAVYTRVGANGVQQVDARGLLAVAFTHRDTRAGDPDLHTHVAISNKVQTTGGRWLALDGRPLHRAAVAASERYNTRLEALLTAHLGLRFANRPGEGNAKEPIREIVGVDPALSTFWSKRRSAITARQRDLASEFTRTHGRAPDFAEQTRLFGRANTDTRQGKHAPRSESEQRQAWRAEASAVLGGGESLATMLAGLGVRVNPVPVEPSTVIDPVWAAWVAADVIRSVADKASTWRTGVVRAEVERRVRYFDVPLAHLDAVVEATLAHALSPELTVRLGDPDELIEPGALRRGDGSSVFSVVGSQLYTSTAVLDAEARIMHAATLVDGRSLDATTVDVALLEAAANGMPLNDGQAALVRDLATSGRRVQLAIAPAGSGKTTALGVLAAAWTEDGGTVVGLAPTGSAADKLRRAIDLPTDTIDKLLYSLDHDSRPGWVDTIGERTLLIVDEAGAASTPALDRVITFALERGASVRLVGDTKQLAHVASGGILRDIAETLGAASLETLVRFADPLEGRASLALRVGDPVALGYYLDHDRIHAGDHTSTIEQAYAAWQTDRSVGRDSILLARTNRVVRELNVRAQAERVAEHGAAGDQVRLHDGTVASAGDTIVTRHNNRRLPITATDWVKNGDRWQVDAVRDDGGLRVTHADTHRSITLPASYVRTWVELGYATTIHLAQGSTADTCHTVLTGAEDRESLYVAMSRGRVGNHVYLDVSAPADAHAATTPEAIHPSTSVELLERVLARESAKRSATTQRRLDEDPTVRLRTACARYRSTVESAPCEPAAGPGPLPWLPALPTVGDPVWDEYLASRFTQVLERAGAVTAVLPDTRWAAALQEKEPALARQVIVWRAAHAVDASDFRPCGPANGDDAAHQRRLEAFVKADVGALLGETERWRPLIDRIAPGLADDPQWPLLARTFTGADAAGYDVEALLPEVIARRPLPEAHGGRSLYYRLCDAWPEAFEPIRPMQWEPPTTASPHPAPPPDYARAFGNPSISRGGPHR
ncbi:MAG: MobF family relaxase [Jatrophihabitans sp.]